MRIVLCLVLVLCLLSTAACNRDLSGREFFVDTKPVPTQAANQRPALEDVLRHWAFGITNGTSKAQSKRIKLTIFGNETDPESLDVAYGNFGQTTVEYQGMQTGNGKHQTYFPLYSGMTAHDYKNSGKTPLGKGANSVFLLQSAALQAAQIPLKSQQDADGNFPAAAPVDVHTAQEAQNGRKVVESRLLATAAGGARLCVFRYQNTDDGRLAVAIFNGKHTAVYNERVSLVAGQAIWRQDETPDSLGYLEPLVLLNTQSGYFLVLAWYGPQGLGYLALHEGASGVLQNYSLEGQKYSVQTNKYFSQTGD